MYRIYPLLLADISAFVGRYLRFCWQISPLLLADIFARGLPYPNSFRQWGCDEFFNEPAER